MGLMDKVKQQANTIAGKTQEGVKTAATQAQEKLGEVQEKRRTDQLLHDLGAAYLNERQGRGTDANKAEIERLVNELSVEKDGSSS